MVIQRNVISSRIALAMMSLSIFAGRLIAKAACFRGGGFSESLRH